MCELSVDAQPLRNSMCQHRASCSANPELNATVNYSVVGTMGSDGYDVVVRCAGGTRR